MTRLDYLNIEDSLNIKTGVVKDAMAQVNMVLKKKARYLASRKNTSDLNALKWVKEEEDFVLMVGEFIDLTDDMISFFLKTVNNTGQDYWESCDGSAKLREEIGFLKDTFVVTNNREEKYLELLGQLIRKNAKR